MSDLNADGVRHDEGVRCVALDGHHRLQRLHWGWDCSVCGAVLRLGVWHPKPDVKTLMDHLEESLAAAKAAFKAEQSDGGDGA